MLETQDYNNFLFEALNSKRIDSAPDTLHESMYGLYKSNSKTLYWSSNYKKFGLNGDYQEENGQITSDFYIAYDVWEPLNIPTDRHGNSRIPTLFLTHGVPVNRKEWYAVARKLARFIRVVMIDLHGMGESSKPLNFKRKNNGDASFIANDRGSPWIWHWGWHAEVFYQMLKDFKRDKPSWFLNGKVFFGANDWGSGALQKFVELYGEELLHGASINSAIALNGYWVQHIGALRALAEAPYPTPAFDNAAIQFGGTITMLLESMYHRTPYIHNQYTMAHLQKPYMEISYSDVRKNPSNTKYNSHVVRVLAEQANHALGNGELLPFHSVKNQNGIKFTEFNIPILMLWGKQDKMMPEKQVHDFDNIFSHLNALRKERGVPSNLKFEYKVLDEAGHFATSDQPERAADALLTWIQNIIGPQHLATTFHGFDSLARQDELHVTKAFDNLNKLIK